MVFPFVLILLRAIQHNQLYQIIQQDGKFLTSIARKCNSIVGRYKAKNMKMDSKMLVQFITYFVAESQKAAVPLEIALQYQGWHTDFQRADYLVPFL